MGRDRGTDWKSHHTEGANTLSISADIGTAAAPIEGGGGIGLPLTAQSLIRFYSHWRTIVSTALAERHSPYICIIRLCDPPGPDFTIM